MLSLCFGVSAGTTSSVFAVETKAGGRILEDLKSRKKGGPQRRVSLLQADYAGGVQHITISPGVSVLPTTGRKMIELISWKNVRVSPRSDPGL
jgi:hypothetical protein